MPGNSVLYWYVKTPGLLDIVFPSRCAVCECAGPNLCGACQPVLTPNPHRFERGPVSGLAATNYSLEVSKLLVAFKDKGQFALVRELSELMSPLVRELTILSETVYLVPAPSRARNYSRRGFTPSVLLARAIANQVPHARVMNALLSGEKVMDQVGLSAPERTQNLTGSMRLNQVVANKVCFIVDDVVTTGATVIECWRVLTAGGAMVLGALAVSESRADKSQ
ncbi:MAG: hypothetical protein RLZZ610_1091 [Actinomycetota bacterium]